MAAIVHVSVLGEARQITAIRPVDYPTSRSYHNVMISTPTACTGRDSSVDRSEMSNAPTQMIYYRTTADSRPVIRPLIYFSP